jgi:hypothetical protein
VCLFIYVIVLSMLSFLFYKIIVTNKINNDLLFFILCNYILSFGFFVFYFYYKDLLYSFVDILFLLINTILTGYELMCNRIKYKCLYLPYLSFVMFIFFIVFDQFLMSL